MKRREFLGSLASVFFVACGRTASSIETKIETGDGHPNSAEGSAPAADGSSDVDVETLTPTSAPEVSDEVFAHGVASGDPRPDRVLLWTRIDPIGAKREDDASFDVSFVVA